MGISVLCKKKPRLVPKEKKGNRVKSEHQPFDRRQTPVPGQKPSNLKRGEKQLKGENWGEQKKKKIPEVDRNKKKKGEKL